MKWHQERGLALAFLFSLSILSEVQSKLCFIRTEVCTAGDEFGFIEANHIRLSTWKCSDFVTRTWHVAYVTGSCKHYKLLEKIDSNEAIADLNDRWQQVPYGGYFILVSSYGGYGGPIREMWSSADNRPYNNFMEFLQSLGIYVNKWNILYPVGDRNTYGSTISTDDSTQSSYRKFNQCRATIAGTEYSGDMSQAVAEGGGSEACDLWDGQQVSLFDRSLSDMGEFSTSLFGELVNDYCRQIRHPRYVLASAPACKTSSAVLKCSVQFCDESSDGISIISRRVHYDLALPHFSAAQLSTLPERRDVLVTVISSLVPNRFVDYSFEADENFCVQPLSSLERYTLDPSQYGQKDRTGNDVQIGNGKMHVVTSDPLGCAGEVYGWQFIPANPGQVYVTVVKEFLPDLSYRGSHRITITESMISDDMKIQYYCNKEHPILNVRLGDDYGFYTDNYESITLAPFKRVFPIKYSNDLQQFYRPTLWHESGQAAIYNLSASDFGEKFGTLKLTVPAVLRVSMSLALKPIMRRDFVYTCGCRTDVACYGFGDWHMKCIDGTCQCREHYIYNSKYNRCVYAKLSRDKPAFMWGTPSSDYSVDYAVDSDRNQLGFMGGSSDDGLWFGSSQGDDNSSNTPTFAWSQSVQYFRSDRPWFAVDLGIQTNVYGVSLKTPKYYDRYIEVWESAEDYEQGLESNFISYSLLQENILSSMSSAEIMVVHGPFAWKFTDTARTESHILNAEHTDGSTLVNVTDLLSTAAEKYVFPIFTGYIFSEYDSFCIGEVDNVLTVQDADSFGDCDPTLGLKFTVEHASDNTILISDGNGSFINYDGTDVTLASTGTPIALYSTAADISNSTARKPLGLTQGMYFVFVDNSNMCMDLSSSDTFVLTAYCSDSRKFVFRCDTDLRFIPTYENWFYRGNTSEAITSSTDSVREIIRLRSNSSSVAGFPANAMRVGQYGVFQESDSQRSDSDGNALVRVYRYLDLLHNFKIGVAKSFDGVSLNPDTFAPCVFVPEAIKPGKEMIFDCLEPVRGRFVSLEVTPNIIDPDELAPDHDNSIDFSLKLEDFNVHTLPGCLNDAEDCIENVCIDATSACAEICMEENEYSGYTCHCTSDGECFLTPRTLDDSHSESRRTVRSAPQSRQDRSTKTSNTGVTSAHGRKAREAEYIPQRYYRQVNSTPSQENSSLEQEAPDPCEFNTLQCEHQCVSTAYGPECQCEQGFILQQDARSCRDLNECGDKNGGCSDVCKNTVGSYHCLCFSGYHLSLDEHFCADANECEDGTETCEQICLNTPGSYQCQCEEGYQLFSDGSCVDENSFVMSMFLNLPFLSEYSDDSSSEYKNLAESLERSLDRDFCQHIKTLSVQCKVSGQIHQPAGTQGLVFRFKVAANQKLTIQNRGLASYELKKVFDTNDHKIEVFGEQVETGGSLNYIHTGSLSWTVTSKCDYLMFTRFCLNNGTCGLDNDKVPYCVCPPDYYDTNCEMYLEIPPLPQKVRPTKPPSSENDKTFTIIIVGFMIIGLAEVVLFLMFLCATVTKSED